MTLQIDHVSIAVKSIATVQNFYDVIMPILGAKKVGQSDNALRYGVRNTATASNYSYLTVIEDKDVIQNRANHWCFRVHNREAVDALYRQGLVNGGADKGPPGLRPDYHEHYYAAFLVDPSGNTIEAVCHLAQS